ncbi:MAG: DUF1553 domain-containing protein, partial [Planctomycetales bacterium]|nr:DUF1553 domain-containing protein [Planctomycetales bacterium]
HHFGRGLVPTPNDFGKQGNPPTHPELLDFLATQFRKSGWSFKAMHRRIMLSQTYQQASMRAPEAVESDPTNTWLSGFPRFRLDAESIRDSLLALGGNLDLSSAGPHPFPAEETWDFTQHKPFKAVYDTNHRSVYLMTQRIQRHPFLAIFDGADPSASTATRMETTTPLQALYLLNDPFVHVQAEQVARRIQASRLTDAARIDFAWQLLFARPATSEEAIAGQQFLEQATSLIERTDNSPVEVRDQAWNAYVRSLFRLNEFVYLD